MGWAMEGTQAGSPPGAQHLPPGWWGRSQGVVRREQAPGPQWPGDLRPRNPGAQGPATLAGGLGTKPEVESEHSTQPQVLLGLGSTLP